MKNFIDYNEPGNEHTNVLRAIHDQQMIYKLAMLLKLVVEI